MHFLNKRNRFTREYNGSFLSFPSYEKFSESRLYEYATPGISILDFILPYPNQQSLTGFFNNANYLRSVSDLKDQQTINSHPTSLQVHAEIKEENR